MTVENIDQKIRIVEEKMKDVVQEAEIETAVIEIKGIVHMIEVVFIRSLGDQQRKNMTGLIVMRVKDTTVKTVEKETTKAPG